MIVVPLAEFLARRGAEWEALLAAAPAESFFQRIEWLAAWVAHPTAARECVMALQEVRGKLAAGLPLQRGRGTIGRWRLDQWEIAGSPWLDRVDVARVDDPAGESLLCDLLEWLTAQRRGWTVFNLREATAGGFLIETAARLAAARGLRVERRVCSQAPCFDFGRNGPRAPSANLRSQLARGAKRLAAAGRVEIAFARPAAAHALDALLDECAAVEALSWKGRTDAGILSRAVPAAFFRPLFHALARGGRLALGTLRVDAVLHAYHLGFLHDGAFLSYNLANRPELQEHGPGTLLLQAMAEQGGALGVTVLDGSRGELERPHLLHRYGGPVRRHEQLLIWRPGARGAAVHLARTMVLPRLRRAKAAVKRLRRGGSP
ncbi:MAG: GNAT family N-acetyltransferase [Planctomycetes bacterium]|nr:GNAT family N-acetyltransferase [Planctomycetota bacterium]